MAARDLKSRTKDFGVRIVKMYSSLPKSTEAQVLGTQALRAGTSVGAHYREGTHGRSSADFISKDEVACQELDETIYWLELLVGSSLIPAPKLAPLQQEARELLAILITCAKNAKTKSRTKSK